jgi:cytochrome d ubiquinol oxidase subunit II
MPEITPALLVAAGLAVALAAYLVMAGADFGGGVWDLFATGPRRKRQRALIPNRSARSGKQTTSG